MTHIDWRTLTQAELDSAYDQSQHAPNMLEVQALTTQLSARARALVPVPEHVTYGPTTEQTLDWYGHDLPNAPLIFFVHGGAWKSGRAQDYALCVHWLRQLGVQLVVPDFVEVTRCGGRLQTLAEQVHQALFYTCRHALSMGADPGRVYVVGHSSGAHLSACMPGRSWLSLGIEHSPIKGLLCCSGMYDLEPVSRSSRRNYVNFSDDVVHDLSPIRHLDTFTMPVRLLCGTLESPEFKRQMDHFGQALHGQGAQVEVSWGQDLNHFEILQTLSEPEGLMGLAVQRLLNR
jgi:arylformamidase